MRCDFYFSLKFLFISIKFGVLFTYVSLKYESDWNVYQIRILPHNSAGKPGRRISNKKHLYVEFHEFFDFFFLFFLNGYTLL